LFYVVVYDISCNKRRKKVADLLEGYGERVQYSVFECVLDRDQYRQLGDRLKKRINLEEDSIRIYPITKNSLQQVKNWGVGKDLTKPPSSTII
jgi:CRISPR-associated protein Cas2